MRVFLACLLFFFGAFFSDGFADPSGWFVAALASQFIDFLILGVMIRAPEGTRSKYYWAVDLSTVIAAFIWSLIFVVLWFEGGSPGQIVAVMSCAGSMLHVSVVCHHSPRLFWLMIGPYAGILLGPMVLGSIVRGDLPLVLGLGLLAAVLGFVANFYASYRQMRAMTESVEAAREEAERGRREADQASAAKSIFLATMSHELRTPLNAVIGYAELLEEDLNEAGRNASAQDATRIGVAGRHLLSLINEVLDLSKIEAGRLEVRPAPFSLPDCIAEVVSTLEQSAVGRGNSMSVSCSASEACVSDPVMVRQCLLNLLSNANKFTANGRISVRAWRDGEMVLIEVSDTGVGMAADKLGLIFEPFVQADASLTRDHGGTGLGLAITRRLARLLGGDVQASSQEGSGSVFTFSFHAPAVAAQAVAQRAV